MTRRWSPIRWWTLLVAVCCAVLGLIVVWPPGEPLAGSHKGQLHLLASSDLADTRDLLAAFTRETGTEVVVDFEPSSEVVRRVSAPEPDFKGKYDAVWISDDLTQTRPDSFEDRLENGRPIMSSALVLGVRADAAARIGSGRPELDWTRLAAADPKQPFSFAMLDPDSDDARAALLGIATDLAGTAEALSPQEAYRISPKLRSLRRHQTLTAATYRELSEAFSRAEGVDAILTLESEILRSNASAAANGSRPLTIVVPRNRAVVSEYRLRAVLAPWGGHGRGEVGRLNEFLTGASAQSWIAQKTYRRPVRTEATAAGVFSTIQPIAVPTFPGLLTELSGIYRDTFHYPTRTVFVLDTSGSMRGAGMRALRRAFRSLNTTIATRHGKDAEILVVPFSSRPGRTSRITVRAAAPAAGLARVAAVVDRTRAGGSTAIYAALQRADQEIGERIADGEEAVTSIILVTDGANTTGPGPAEYTRHRRRFEQTTCTSRNRERCRTPVHAVLIGKAELAQMQALATATGGSVHDARKANLTRILQAVTAPY